MAEELNILIIEDEPATAKRLERMITEIQPAARILDILDTVGDTVKYFQTHSDPDLIFMDIQLADGNSFEIFHQVEISTPVIFTTAYDEYAIKAFKVNSIDYLLKPIKREELVTSLKKFRKMNPGTAKMDFNELASLIEKKQKPYLRRMMIRIGQKLKAIDMEEAAYFYVDQKIVYVMTRTGDRYPVDFTLEALEKELDPSRFFRINRSFIVSFESIGSMTIYSKSRIKINLEPPSEIEAISSTEKSGPFKEWLKGK